MGATPGATTPMGRPEGMLLGVPMGAPSGALQHDNISPRAARKTEPWPMWGSSCQLELGSADGAELPPSLRALLGTKDGTTLVAEMGVNVGGEPDSRELLATGGATPTNGTPIRSALALRRGFATAVAGGGGSMGLSDGSSLGATLGATLGAAGFEDAALGTLLQGAASQVASSLARAPADAARLASMG
jgi:hypothetical protein